MNVVNLLGRITKDLELKDTGTTKLLKFSLAVARQKKGEVDFITCTAFGATAEVMEKWLIKGSQIALTGRIQTGNYKNKDGNTVYTTDVIVQSFYFADSKKKEEELPYDLKDDTGVPF